jgi:outer membrane protein assembly factor BamB
MHQFTPSGIRKLSLVCLCLVLGSTSLVLADPPPGGNWPQWRGVRRDNVSDDRDLLKDWPADGPRLGWEAKGLGPGYAGVAVAAGRVYTMGDGEDACYVIALDEATGNRIWAAKVGPPGDGGGYPGPRSTPTVDPADGKHLYALGQHGDIVCIEIDGGKEVWHKQMKADLHGIQVGMDLSGRAVPAWGYSEGLLVDGDRLVCTPGGGRGTLAALDKRTGEVLWRTTDWTDPAVYCSIVPATIAGVRQYVQLTGWTLAGVEPETGKVLWRQGRLGGPAVIATPVVRGDDVYVTSGYGIGCQRVHVTKAADGTFFAEVAYWNRSMKNHIGGVVLVGDCIYGSSDPGILVCMDLATGDVKWKDRSVGKGSVVAADGMLYVRSEDGKGTVALIEAKPDGYKEHGRFDPPDRSKQSSWPPPVVTGGRLYLRDQDVLLCYDVRSK